LLDRAFHWLFPAQVTNVAFRVRGRNGRGGAVLVNAHLDSFGGAPGAFDDLVGVGVMIEAVRALAARGESALARDVVFLVNGAEENHQLGAHAFATQHDWAKNVEFVLNLESMGAGDRELVFQCGAEDVAAAVLAGAVGRRANVIAHELFQFVLWRAAKTDYAVFLDFLPEGARGTDSAFVDDGWVYHTPLDGTPTAAAAASLGANLLASVDRLGALPRARAPPAPTYGYVYFDVLGLVVVFYGSVAAKVSHVAVAAFGLVHAARRSSARGAAVAAVRTLGAVLAAAAAAAAFGGVLALAAPMRWYAGGRVVAVALFLPPAAAAYAAAAPRDGGGVGPVALWSGVLLAAAAADLGSGYVAAVNALALVAARPWALAPALLLWIAVAHTMLLIALPLLGRVGGVVQPDPVLGAVFGLLAGLGLTLAAPRRPGPRPPARAVALGLAALAAAAALLPAYGAATPKRLTIQHVTRSVLADGGGAVASSESGLWVLPMDGRGLAPALAGARAGSWRAALRDGPVPRRADPSDCYMRWPWFFPLCDIVRGDAYAEAPPPELPSPARLAATRAGDVVAVAVRAPSSATLALRGDVAGWTFEGVDGAAPPPPRPRADGVFLLQLTGGTCRDACDHALAVALAPGARLELALAAHHVEVDATPPILELLAELPAWAKGGEWGKWASELLYLDVPPPG